MTKSQLALLYFPHAETHVATNRLTRWINLNQSLREELEAAGYRPRQRRLTAAQVRIIVAHLGEP